MRISTTLMFRTGLDTINAQQSDLLHLYQQVGTGRRMVTPSDDPLAAARTINLGQTQAQNIRFGANREVAKQSLGTEDNVLKTVVRTMQEVRTRLVEAGDGSYSDKDRQSLATTLRHSYELLVNQANAKDGNGQYLFSGSSGNVQPYARDPLTNQVYLDTANLVDGARNIQVDQSRQLSSGDMAKNIFGDPTSGSPDLFATLDAIIAALETPVDNIPGASTALQSQLMSATGRLDELYDQVLTVQASVGARLNEIDALDANGDLRNLSYRKELMNLEDADYYEATSMLTLRQAALEAAAMAFRRIQSTSLFNQQ